MAVPKRYARHLSPSEWRRLALDSLTGPDRGLVLNVLNAITSVDPASEEDRCQAVESLIRYAAQLGAAPDLHGITEGETRGAIQLADQALDGLRGGADDAAPHSQAGGDGAEEQWE